MNERDERAYEMTIEIEASVEAVWRALTDGAELTRWFPLDASVEPGPGGSLRLSWGPDLEWHQRIDRWEPGRHLRLVEEREPGRVLAVDYRLERRGGSTIVRLVHSGFGRGADWDEEFDAISGGWPFELRSLRLYLERHRGRARHVGLVRRAVERPAADVQAQLLSLLAPERGLVGLAEGATFSTVAATGESLTGTVVIPPGPSQFTATIREYDDGLLRLMTEKMAGVPTAWVWISDWGSAGADRTKRFERDWGAAVDRVLAGG